MFGQLYAMPDPAQFEEPDDCVMTRHSTTPHLAFGLGVHFCLGAGLARTESRIALQLLLARCVDLQLDIDVGDVPYERSYMVHGIRRLPLRIAGRTIVAAVDDGSRSGAVH